MATSRPVQQQLESLAAHLRERRPELLRLWRDAINRDPELTTSAGLSHAAFEDHIPSILQDFEDRLRAEDAQRATQVGLQEHEHAAEHGQLRWQQGFDIRETMHEWAHLQTLVLQEIAHYVAARSDMSSEATFVARESLTTLCMEGNCESASRFMQMQQAEAASRVLDLEGSLQALQALENERAKLLRETAHDLRGGVGVIANATAMLAKSQVRGADQERFYGMLQQRIRSVGALLTDLVELSRLEAGQDPLKIEEFDACEKVREFCEVLRTVATARNLYLSHEGPRSIPVEGDLLKLQRIVQNLLVNALQATQRGGVMVRCHVGTGKHSEHWVLSVEDTGPGFTLQSAGVLRHALKRATDEGHRLESDSTAGVGERGGVTDARAAASGPDSAVLPSGEGVGLSIVKRLCDLLGASIELETAPGHGTTFRIKFPTRYSTAPGPGGS